METLVAIVHIIACLSLISLVLIQDSKGGGALGMGGGGANSLLGATGAQTLAAKMTRVVAILFAATCLYLTWSVTQGNSKSVIDGQLLPTPPAATTPAATAETTPANAPATAPAAETAAPAPAEPKK